MASWEVCPQQFVSLLRSEADSKNLVFFKSGCLLQNKVNDLLPRLSCGFQPVRFSWSTEQCGFGVVEGVLGQGRDPRSM